MIKPVADPGFPVGGAPTSNMGTFWQKCMRERKNWILLGGAPAAPPRSANENCKNLANCYKTENIHFLQFHVIMQQHLTLSIGGCYFVAQ